MADDYYYDVNYEGYDNPETVPASSLPATSISTTTTTIVNTPPITENTPPPQTQSLPWGGPFGSLPEIAPSPEGELPGVEPESPGAQHPFGENPLAGIPTGEPEGHPFGEPEGHPFGEPEGHPFGEPEGQPGVLIREWNVYQCTGYSNPLMPEPEGEPGAEPEAEPENYGIGGGAYAEPPAPLLQSVNFRDRGTYSTLSAVVATLIIFLNIAVLVAICRKPKQRKSLTYFIGLLAVFDLLGGLQFLWFSSFDMHLMYTHANMWILVMCGIWMLSMAPQITATMHFGLHLWTELCNGVGNAKTGHGKIIFIAVTVFLLPIALFIPPLAGWNCIGCVNPVGEQYCENKCSIPIFPFTKAYVLLMTVLLLAAMLGVVIIYVVLHTKVGASDANKQLAAKSGKCNAIALSQCLLAIYIVCTIPVAVVMIADVVTVECNPYLINAFHATLFVTFLSNLVNPIVVFWMMPTMRNALLQSGNESQGGDVESKGVNGAFTMEEHANGVEDRKLTEEEAASKL